MKSCRYFPHAFATARCHRCESTLRVDAPPTGWVTALAGLLARGSLASSGLPSFPVAVLDEASPLTVAGAATDEPQTGGRRVPSCLPGSRRGTSTLKCSSYERFLSRLQTPRGRPMGRPPAQRQNGRAFSVHARLRRPARDMRILVRRMLHVPHFARVSHVSHVLHVLARLDLLD